MSLRSLVLTSIAAFACSASAYATTFNLASVPAGTVPTFSITANGTTATFTSDAGNGFETENTTGLLSFNTGLVDFSFFSTDPLTITFSSPVSFAIQVPFAFLDSGATTDALTIAASNGQMATFLASPTNLPLGDPEGLASLSLTSPITSVTLTGNNAFSGFAVGNVTSTPEPASIALLGTGLASMAGMVLRRRRA